MSPRAGSRTAIAGAGRAALVPAGALAVHQLRFALAFGHASGTQLARTGHSYLHSLAPWLVALLGVAVGSFLWSLGRALAGQRSVRRYTVSLAGLWVVCAASLIAIYAAQELLEGFIATGHAAGLVGVFGYGGWWAIPAAFAVGLVLAAVCHGARWALDTVAQRARRPRALGRTTAAAPLRPLGAPMPRLIPLAGGSSGRGPPR
jgi:hypothetical protein